MTLPTVHEAVVLCCIAFVAGFMRLAAGMGAGATLTPVAVWGFGSPVRAVAAMAGILWFTDVQGVLAYWRRWDMRLMKLMLPTTVAATLAGAFFLTVAPARLIRHLIGLVALAFVASQLWARQRGRGGAGSVPPWLAGTAGVGVGFISAVANSGGLILTMLLLYENVERAVFISSTAFLIGVMDTLKIGSWLAARTLTVPYLLLDLAAVPCLALGGFVGKRVTDRLNHERFVQIVLAFMLVLGLDMLLR